MEHRAVTFGKNHCFLAKTGFKFLLICSILIGPLVFGGFIARSFQRLSKVKSTAAYFPIGLLLGLLPCGPVYTALLAAAGAGMKAGDPVTAIIKGMGVMVCFGLGTIPALFLVAKLADMGWLKKRELIYRIGAVLMVIVGIYFIIKEIQY